MGFFDSDKRPIEIKVLNVEDDNVLTYMMIYGDRSTKNVRKNVKDLHSSIIYTSPIYSSTVHIVSALCLGKVYSGLIKNDVRMVFLVTLSDQTVDIVQEKEGTKRCTDLLAMSMLKEQNETEIAESTSVQKEEDLDIPIEVLPNLYSLSISNVSLKHHQTYKDGKKEFDYVTLKCRVNYQLNGRKEGKRHIIFTSYDKKDRIVEVRGEHKKYYFTEAGYEFVEIGFDDYSNNPITKISISIKEI